MKKKVLFTAKVDSHIKHFHLPFLSEFNKHGYEVHVASEGDSSFENCDIKYNVFFGANPFSKDVKNSYKRIKELLKENEYEIVHTHTAIASVITRLAIRRSLKKENRPRVIYTAHGFHFLKGGKKSSWILYYPIEYFFSKITDDLIVINKEDYELAKRKKLGRNLHYVPGVGIDLEYFKKFPREESTNFVITYIAELNDNKNQKLLLEAVSKLINNYPQIRLLLVGEGSNKKDLQNIIENYNLSNNVKMLGYRKDVRDILNSSDLAVSTSLREGLPVNIIESMAMNLPIIATKCRGHNDLVKDSVNGFLVEYSAEEIASKIKILIDDSNLRSEFGDASRKLVQDYGIKNVIASMNQIYFNEMKEG